jgi:hypothetical protein
MTVPRLKRIRVSSEQELDNWLAKNSEMGEVLLVTCGKKSLEKFISSEQVRATLGLHGWTAGSSYTLKGNLVGHVAKNA